TAAKYGKLCFRIAGNILARHEDREECVSDTYLKVWNSIPTARPKCFSAFIGRIARNLALDKFAYLNAEKRGQNVSVAFEELSECVSGEMTVEGEMEKIQLAEMLNRFLVSLEKEKRIVFVYRYWYFASVEMISRRMGFSESKVKSMLFQLRRKLRVYLESEGIEV
ncbi:MAG: sigma-70 family RNA polymerase sigma factor, partial [Oscillospiraceae bacterium]|nr:sigma-70 family RNA polymerase sigma factor [Oscillospiraceae bacterium]